MNKKANGDIISFIIAFIVFTMIVGGVFITIKYIYTDSGVDTPDNLIYLANLSDESSEINAQIDIITSSLPESEESSTVGGDLFENNMFVKAFRVFKKIIGFPKFAYTFTRQVLEIVGMPSWVIVPFLSMMGVFIIIMLALLLRGLTR
jgi:hypothetical protein